LGNSQIVGADAPEVLIIRYNYQGKCVLIAHNFRKDFRQTRIPLGANPGKKVFLTNLTELLTRNQYKITLTEKILAGKSDFYLKFKKPGCFSLKIQC